jgi:hypothetical protein
MKHRVYKVKLYREGKPKYPPHVGSNPYIHNCEILTTLNY